MPYVLLYRKVHPYQVEECLQIIEQSFAKDEKYFFLLMYALQWTKR